MPRDYDLTAKAMIAGAEKAIADATRPLVRRIDELERQRAEREAVLETIKAEIVRSEELRTAEHRAAMAEHREALAGLRLQIETKLLEVRDGRDGTDGKDGRDGIDGKDGKGADMEALFEAVRNAVAEIPTPKDGTDGRDGKDGADAYPGAARGLYDPEATYRALDVVSLNGSEWRAKIDNPGPLPGDDWMLSAQRGKRGEQGQRGERGLTGGNGKDGAQPVAMALDMDNLKLVTVLDDGNQLEADFEPFVRAIRGE